MEEGKGKRTAKSIEDTTATPFEMGQLEETLEELVRKPTIGEPFQPTGAKRNRGQNYQQVKLLLVPGIVLLFEKGYNRRMVQADLAKQLKVGNTNKFVQRLVKDGLETYLKKQFGEK